MWFVGFFITRPFSSKEFQKHLHTHTITSAFRIRFQCLFLAIQCIRLNSSGASSVAVAFAITKSNKQSILQRTGSWGQTD